MSNLKSLGLYDFVPEDPGELAFRKGDIISVTNRDYKDWWEGSLRGKSGIFPLNYIKKLEPTTVADLRREHTLQNMVYDQIPKVEKLMQKCKPYTSPSMASMVTADLSDELAVSFPILNYLQLANYQDFKHCHYKCTSYNHSTY